MRLRTAFAASLGIGSAALLFTFRHRITDRVVELAASRPGGWIGRRLYTEPAAHQASFDATLEALALTPEDRLLELGCGGGSFLDRALAGGCSAKAIDHSPDMIALCGHRNQAAIGAGHLELAVGDAGRLPYPDGTFTAVASTNAFFFFADPAAVLREAHRVLATGGRLAIFTSAPDAPARHAPRPFAQRMYRYPDDELRQMLTDAGFDNVTVLRKGMEDSGQLATAERPD